MAIFNGTDLILKVSPSLGGAEAKLMHSQNVSLSDGFRDILAGQMSFSLSADGLMDFDAQAADTEVDELFDQMFDRSVVTFTFALSTPVGYTITGSGFITSLEISGGTEDAPTYSCTIEGTGTLTKTAV